MNTFQSSAMQDPGGASEKNLFAKFFRNKPGSWPILKNVQGHNYSHKLMFFCNEVIQSIAKTLVLYFFLAQLEKFFPEVLLGVFGIRNICEKNYRDTGYLRKKLLGYRILRSSFRDTKYAQKIVTYQMFDEKRSWITQYMPFSVFLLMIRYK